MSEHYFNALEQKIDQLLEHCQQLEQDNRRLREQETVLQKKQSQLLEASEQSRARIEMMVQRLQALEHTK